MTNDEALKYVTDQLLWIAQVRLKDGDRVKVIAEVPYEFIGLAGRPRVGEICIASEWSPNGTFIPHDHYGITLWSIDEWDKWQPYAVPYWVLVKI